jgi:PKD repeat protein
MTVYGQNVAPTATVNSVTASAPLVITPQGLLTFKGGFTDPGKLDTHTANWDFGDATSASGFTATHSYDRPGTYRVVFTVTDDDGGVGTATTYVTVLNTQQALTRIAGFVNGLTSLNVGQRNSLVAKLNAASAAAARGDNTAASNQLNAFLNEVRAYQTSGKLSAGDAATLRNAVYAVKGAIGTYNRFLEWWPLAL